VSRDVLDLLPVSWTVLSWKKFQFRIEGQVTEGSMKRSMFSEAQIAFV
jgi:hypothetical protein